MKKKLLIIGIVAVAVALCAWLAYSLMSGPQQEVEQVWNKLMADDITVKDNPAYAACKDSKQLEKRILSFAEETDEPIKLAKMGLTLSKIGYEKPAVKTALAEKIKQTLPKVRTTPLDYLEVLALVSDAGDSFYPVSSILPEAEFIAYLEEFFEKAAIKKGAGGYYDGEQNRTTQTTNDLLATVTEKHAYFGDFYLYDYTSEAYRPTGEDWEDDLMTDYDVKSRKLYYQGNLLNCVQEFTDHFTDYAYGAEEAYMMADCVVIIRSGKAYTTMGNIFYNREVSAYEELTKHAAAICIPEAAYDDAGDAAMWYFSDNKDLFPALATKQIAEVLPGQWTIYYLYANNEYAEFKADGTCSLRSGKEYPWGAENDLFCYRTTVDGSWHYQYEVRQATEDLYLLYQPGESKLQLVLQKTA